MVTNARKSISTASLSFKDKISLYTKRKISANTCQQPITHNKTQQNGIYVTNLQHQWSSGLSNEKEPVFGSLNRKSFRTKSFLITSNSMNQNHCTEQKLKYLAKNRSLSAMKVRVYLSIALQLQTRSKNYFILASPSLLL